MTLYQMVNYFYTKVSTLRKTAVDAGVGEGAEELIEW